MVNEPQIQLLVDEVLDSGRSPEEVCRDHPALLSQVREALHRVQAIEAELDGMFPTPREAPPMATGPLPQIPGYEIQGILGHGGMGVVYRALHLKLERHVAVKMLLAGAYASAAEIERFQREAIAVARLQHPNIVQVHDVGECEGRPFFTMELLEGGSLAMSLGGRPLPAREAATLLATLAEAVHAAHGSGIVHRDLKPANVLLTADGLPKIADFGLARPIGGQPGLTLTGARLGTPSYMAPEQALGRRDEIGPAVDVYALGAVLYEVLTGRPPFHAETPAETERQVIAMDPVAPSRLNASVPRDLETICLKSLHKEPPRRYATAAELAADLGRFLRHEPIVARRIGRVSRGLRWVRRKPAVAALLVLVASLLTLGTGLLVQDRVLAAERDANSLQMRPKIDRVAQLLGEENNLQRAELLLQEISGPLTSDLIARVSELQSELQLVKDLDGVRSLRLGVVDGRFDPAINQRLVEDGYERRLRAAGFAVAVDAVPAAAARIRDMDVRRQLVEAFDDWATCSSNPVRVNWIFQVARVADPDPRGWRERFRDSRVFVEPQSLRQLAEDVQVDAQPVAILVHLAQAMHGNGVDNVPFLRRIQRSFPGDFWVNFMLGHQLTADQRPEESIRYLQAALAVRPLVAVAHDALGRALAAGNQMAEARDCFLTAVKIEPGFARAHADLGRANAELGELESAQEALEAAVKCDPLDAQSHFYLGGVLLERDDVDAAIAALQQAVRLAPTDAVNHERLAKALEKADRHDEAKAEHETMRRLVASGPRALLAQNRLDEALAAMSKAVAVQPKSTSSICELGDCLARLGRRDDAVEQFRRAVALEPTHEYARQRLLGLLVALGRHDDAVAVYEQTVADHPDQPGAWDGYAELCLYLARTDDYNRVRARVLERFSSATNARACELVGRVCLLQPPDAPQLHLATEAIDQALAGEPATRAPGPMHAFHITKHLALYRAGRFEEATSYMGSAPRGDLGPAPLFVAAMALHRLGKTDQAWRLLCMADLFFDWRPMHAIDRLDWLKHVLRREAESVIAPHLPDLLAGRRRAEEDEDRGILLAACCATNLNARAASLYAELLTGNSKMAVCSRASAYRAACIAAAAGAGIGADADSLDEAGRARCRWWAQQWLGVVLTRKAADFAALAPEPREQLITELRFWTYDPELAPLRESAGLEKRPKAEREALHQLWERLATLLAQAQRPTTAPAGR